MQLKRSPSEKRHWPNTFLSLVHERYPGYKINIADKGNCTELCRDVDGLFHLQSAVWRNGQYSHCFAVSLTFLMAGPLNSPFWAGARSDPNHTIFHGFERDLGAQVRGPNRLPGLHSTHARKTGFADVVKQCTTNAETHLAAHYRRTLMAAAPLLLRCVDLIDQHPGILTDKTRHTHFAQIAGSVDLSAQDFAGRPSAWRNIPEIDLPEAIIAAAPDKFTPYVSDIAGIAARLRKLV